MKASDLFVQCLENEGTEYVFAVPGEENLDLLESLRKSSIRVIVTRHEQAAAFMAANYGRLTGKVGVCMSTLGPGATNLVTGVAYAQLGGMPLLAITGQKAIRDNWQANFQVLDVVNMMRPITKRALQIQGPRSIPKEIRGCFKIALRERQGACHIELPEDIAGETVSADLHPLPITEQNLHVACQEVIEKAADQIKKAKNPILIVSSRAQRETVSQALIDFCNQTNLYVIHTQLGKGVLPPEHPNCLYAFGIHKHDFVNCVVDRSDLIITVGYSTVEHPPSVWNKNQDKKIMHVDFCPGLLDIYYAPHLEVIGDIARNIRALGQSLEGYRYQDSYNAKVRQELEQVVFKPGAREDAYPLKPRRIVADCRQVLDPSDIICMDNGIYKLWFSRHYKTHQVHTFLLDNTLASMGAGLPSAMAAKLINPRKKVLAVCGDGGFMMNSQEIETCVRLKLNVVVLILNDNAYGFIKWKQSNYGFEDFGLDLGNPDFVTYAQSYGAKGYKINSADQLMPTLQKAFQEELPVIVECPIDYSENKSMWGKDLDGVICPV